nr:MAG TPA: arginine repressor [Caudoviricetes sp.]
MLRLNEWKFQVRIEMEVIKTVPGTASRASRKLNWKILV